MKRLTRLSPTLAVVFMLVFMASGMAWAEGPREVEFIQAEDGTPYLEVADVDVHPFDVWAFYAKICDVDPVEVEVYPVEP